jgi:hypothetical protein
MARDHLAPGLRNRKAVVFRSFPAYGADSSETVECDETQLGFREPDLSPPERRATGR